MFNRTRRARLLGPSLALIFLLPACDLGFEVPPDQLPPSRPIAKFGDVTYQACIAASPRPYANVMPCNLPSLAPLTQADLGEEKYRLATTIQPGFPYFHNQLRDGMGRDVAVGTSFYELPGHDAKTLLVAWMDGQWVPFWRHPASEVTRGSDILEIEEGRASFATIRKRAESTDYYKKVDGYLLSREAIDALIRELEAAPVDPQAQAAGKPYDIEFVQGDRHTAISYWSDPGVVLQNVSKPSSVEWSPAPLYVAIRMPADTQRKLDAAIDERAEALASVPTSKKLFYFPAKIAIDDAGSAWVTDQVHAAVYRLRPSLEFNGNLDDGRTAAGLAIAQDHTLWTASDSSIKHFSPEGKLIREFIQPGAVDLQDVAIDRDGNVWVTGNVLHKLAPDGSVLGTSTLGHYRSGGEMDWQIALDKQGYAWITDSEAGAVLKYAPDMTLVGKYPVGKTPRGIAIDGDAHVWVANSQSGTITKLDADGVVLGSYPAGIAPYGVAIDAKGEIWVTDSATSGLNHLGRDGASIRRYWTHDGPGHLAIDAEGYVWISNLLDGTVSRMAP